MAATNTHVKPPYEIGFLDEIVGVGWNSVKMIIRAVCGNTQVIMSSTGQASPNVLMTYSMPGLEGLLMTGAGFNAGYSRAPGVYKPDSNPGHDVGFGINYSTDSVTDEPCGSEVFKFTQSSLVAILDAPANGGKKFRLKIPYSVSTSGIFELPGNLLTATAEVYLASPKVGAAIITGSGGDSCHPGTPNTCDLDNPDSTTWKVFARADNSAASPNEFLLNPSVSGEFEFDVTIAGSKSSIVAVN